MGFFNSISKKTLQTTSKITKEARLRMIINDNKGEIKELYEQIGKTAYENHIRENDENLKKLIEDNCLKIDQLSKEIEEYRKEILILNHKKMCKKCYSQIESEDLYCPKCGEKQTNEKNKLEKAEEKIKNIEIPENKVAEAEIVKEELQRKNNS